MQKGNLARRRKARLERLLVRERELWELGAQRVKLRGAWIARARHVPGVNGGRVDRLLEVPHAEVHPVQKGLERPLILLIAARGPERQQPTVGEPRE